MGCFLGCFGYPKKRKRRKPSNKIESQDQGSGAYVPLDSKSDEITEEPKILDSNHKDIVKGKSSTKIKKKVSFNLNVRTYEPLPKDDMEDYFWEEEEKTKWDFKEEEEEEEEIGSGSQSILHFEEDGIASNMRSYPSTYRYYNCRDGDDEEEEMTLDDNESDLEDEEDDVDDITDEGYSDASLGRAPESDVRFAQLAENDKSLILSRASTDQEMNNMGWNQNGRSRCQHVNSVLNPVENLSQWKAIKAKPAQALKHQKENMTLEIHKYSKAEQKTDAFPAKTPMDLNQSKSAFKEVAVDASLSNWLI